MAQRRSTGSRHVARALWYTSPGIVELRTAQLPQLMPDHAVIRTLYSGISRGTERLVHQGHIAQSEFKTMRAPLQEGDFSFPVKYGYCTTGVVIAGPDHLADRTVFCLHPHQDVFHAPVTMLAPLPEGVPAKRATLAANMETALNAHWDAGTGPGNKIVVVGGGIVGLLTAYLAQRIPGTDVTLIDTARDRDAIACSLDVKCDAPERAPENADVVFHASATSEGLHTALKCAGFEAAIVEMSWYGSKTVTLPLGSNFHSQRLKLISSQVGHIAPSHRARWSHARRLEAALTLLSDSALDALVNDEIAFHDTPAQLPAILAEDASGLAPVIAYPEA